MAHQNKFYPRLFTPLTIKGRTLKNRIVASPQNGAPNLVRAGTPGNTNFTETAVQYYGGIARGGAGIVNTGHLGVDPEYYLGTDHDHFDFYSNDVTSTPMLTAMADTIHAYGALASLELNHGGHLCRPVHRDYLLGPCDTVSPEGNVRAMDEKEMIRVAGCFAEAACLGMRCGFDIINVHGGHGWLLGAFFSPVINKRSDSYGGNWENRARFPRMVLEKIREKVGNSMIIEMRFSVSEYTKGGITLAEAADTIDSLSDIIDIVQCTGGTVDNPYSEGYTMSVPYIPHGCNVKLASEMKKRIRSNILMEVVGAVNEPELAEQILAEGNSDLVAMARSFMADPNWAEKARRGKAGDIRPCIRCMRCFSSSTPQKSNRSKCSVNPRRSLPIRLPASELLFEPKQVAVLGGGAAGMQAAKELAEKGHHVTLIEKRDRLGGVLTFTDHVAFKDDLRRYRDYLIRQVTGHPNIDIRMGTAATPELLKHLHPDAVVAALGATPFIPPIPGADRKNVIHAVDMFGRENELGDKIVLIGAGFVGCEATVHLQSLGKTVDVVEMAERLMPEEPSIEGESFFTQYYMIHDYQSDRLPAADEKETGRVKIHLQAKCIKIEENGALIRTGNGFEEFIEADTIVMSTGFRSNKRQAEIFEDAAEDFAVIGDCRKVGNIMTASEDGYYVSLQI